MKDPHFYVSRLQDVQRELEEVNPEGETDLENCLVTMLCNQFHYAGAILKAAHLATWDVLEMAKEHSPAAEKLLADMLRTDVT